MKKLYFFNRRQQLSDFLEKRKIADEAVGNIGKIFMKCRKKRNRQKGDCNRQKSEIQYSERKAFQCAQMKNHKIKRAIMAKRSALRYRDDASIVIAVISRYESENGDGDKAY